MRYIMEIRETLTRRVPVEASSFEEAYKVVDTLYKNEEITLGSEDFLEGDVYTYAEPTKKIFFNGSILLTGDRVLHIFRLQDGFEWYFETKEGFSPTVRVQSDAKMVEEILPMLLRNEGVKEEEIVEKYDDFHDFASLVNNDKVYSLKDIEEGE